MMMKPSDTEKNIRSFNGESVLPTMPLFNVLMSKYKKGLMFFFHHRWMVWTSLGLASILLVYLMSYNQNRTRSAGRPGNHDDQYQYLTGKLFGRDQ